MERSLYRVIELKDFSTTVEMTMSGEGFASLNDLIFLISLKIKNMLVVNRYKDPSTPLPFTDL